MEVTEINLMYVLMTYGFIYLVQKLLDPASNYESEFLLFFSFIFCSDLVDFKDELGQTF